MRDEAAIATIKAATCPQDLAGEIVGSGLNEVTVDIAAESLDGILAETEHDPAHDRWLDRELGYGQQLWAMLVQDFPANLAGKECPV